MKLIVCRLIVFIHTIIMDNSLLNMGGKMMSLLHVFAINTRKIRTAQGLSQEALAEKAGLHRTFISSVERECRNLSIENIEKIANALGRDAYELLLPIEKTKR